MRRPFSLVWKFFFGLACGAELFSQSSAIQVGQGAPTDTIRNEFQVAYQRADFFSVVTLPPLTEVTAYGTGGFRQEFTSTLGSATRSALIRPATPDLSQGLTNAVRQVRAPIYPLYIQSGIGVSTAGFPRIDTTEFTTLLPGVANAVIGGLYQTFDRNFAIFLWNEPPNQAGTERQFNIADPIYTRWASLGLEQIGPPTLNSTAVTSRFTTRANYQVFTNGAIYQLTSGAFTGRVIFVRRSVFDLYERNQGPAGFLGLPVSEETILADGRRRQSFEGGTMEYALNGTPVLKNALSAVTIVNESPLRLSAGQTATLDATLLTTAGELVSDREVFWTTSNGRVATIVGSGNRVTLRAVAGGTATITATSEGRSSRALTVFVTAQCCALGEGAPTQAISQTFLDAVQRNRLTLRTPLATPVRRTANGFTQEAIALPAGNRVLIAKSDATPLAYVVSGPILAAYDSFSGPLGSLGYPTSDANPNGSQSFDLGVLAGSPVRLIAGGILARWRGANAENGPLGLPTSAANTTVSFTGAAVAVQRFRGGAIHQHLTGTFAGRILAVVGPIAARHAELGGAAGTIGAPINEEFVSAGVNRQEFEGAFLEYTGAGPVTVVEKPRRPTLTISPNSILPGGRIRVAAGGFPANSRLRFTQGTGASADVFEALASNGSFVYETLVPSNARTGVVTLRAASVAETQSIAEGSYTVRSLAELRPAITKLLGDSQTGAPATTLPIPLRIALRDSSGNPISGIPVRFEASPGATVLGPSITTAADGTAEARLRLPNAAGIVLVTVESGGQFATFNARATAQAPSDFPRISQNVDGNLGNSTLPLAQKGALLASVASVVRFYQNRGVVPTESGLADTATLNNYLRAFCALDSAGQQLCDGFLDLGPNTDPQPNLFRIANFSSGVLDLTVEDPTLTTLRELVAQDSPVILALDLTRNAQPAGTHFVAAFGVAADGDLSIADPNPNWNRNLLSQYTSGFAIGGTTYQARLVGALRLLPRASSAAFAVVANNMLSVASPAAPCSRVASWSATFADAASAAAGPVFFQSCDGTASAYQLSLPNAPYLLNLVSFTNPAARTITGGGSATVFRIAKSGEAWLLSQEQLSFSTETILNAANFAPRISAGSIISIFGSGLPSTDQPSGVELNGVGLPIFFSNGFQLNTAIPPDTPAGPTNLRLTSRFGESSATLDIVDASPGIFLLDAPRRGAILNQDGTINSPTQPAIRGQAVIIFSTGLGVVTRQPNNLSTTANPVTVRLNDSNLTPFYAGLAPGFIGLYQVNVIIPTLQAPGLDQTLTIRISGSDSNAVDLAIR
jgi:uncharacterized protein (TIGR03437 family)